MHIPDAKSRLRKQLLSNFQDDNSCDRKHVKAAVNNRVAYKKCRTILRLKY